MNHYVLTRSRRGPDYPLDANLRRIELARGITARSLRDQPGDWTWLVYVHPDDPLLPQRLDAFRSCGHRVVPVYDNAHVERVIDWTEPVLTTRIDDDDGFSTDAFARLYDAVRRCRRRTVLVFPVGHRINEGLSQRVTHIRNAWSSLYAPFGDRTHVRMVTHNRLAHIAPVQYLDNRPAWLWVRHEDAESRFRRAHDLITPEVRALYPVDWALLHPRELVA